MNKQTYGDILKRADAAQVCRRKHWCERREHVMSEWTNGIALCDKCGETATHFAPCDSLIGDEEDVEFQCKEHAQLLSGLIVAPRCLVCEAYEHRRARVSEGIHPAFLVVAEGISRHYLHPAEGGIWGDATEVLEVRRAYTFEAGLRHAKELRDAYPQPRFNRFSCANRGEPEVYIRCVYSESDPRMPENYYPSRTYE